MVSCSLRDEQLYIPLAKHLSTFNTNFSSLLALFHGREIAGFLWEVVDKVLIILAKTLVIQFLPSVFM
jgi:hypothetical protein